MFKIDCFAEDRNLASVLRALAGVARDVKAVPVTNVEVKANGKMEAPTNGHLLEMFLDHIKKTKPVRIDAASTRAFCSKVGAAPSSYTYILQKAQKRGLIRKAGKHTGRTTSYVLTGAGK